MVLEKTLESPLDSKEIKPVHPKEISPEYSLKGLVLKQSTEYFGHLMRRADSLQKTLMLGKIEPQCPRSPRGTTATRSPDTQPQSGPLLHGERTARTAVKTRHTPPQKEKRLKARKIRILVSLHPFPFLLKYLSITIMNLEL